MSDFSELLAAYLSVIGPQSTEATIRHRCLEFLRTALGIDILDAEDQLEQPVFRGRIDAMLGRLVIEFKRDLSDSLAEAEAQLEHYLAELHRQNPTATYTGVACDGVQFHIYQASYDDTGRATLDTIGFQDLKQATDPNEAYLWLDGLFAHFRADRAMPTARSIVVALGPNSPNFRRAFVELSALFKLVKGIPEVAVRYQEWQRYLSIVYGSDVGDEDLFVRHTYLSLLARLIARFSLEPRFVATGLEDLRNTILGDYFREQGIDNFIEDDFFTWFLVPSAAQAGLAVAYRLANSLAGYDFSLAQQDLLKGLYEELVDPETRHDLGEYYTPDWLAGYIIDAELGLTEDPLRSLLDPSCGSGTFLFTAIRIITTARLSAGEDEFSVLLTTVDQVMGIDVHPVAVIIARTNYLLALGSLLHGPHPPVILPVYLSNSIDLPGSTSEEGPESLSDDNGESEAVVRQPALSGGYPEAIHTIATSEPGVVFELPNSVATNLDMLDWLFARLPNYLNAVELRRHGQAEAEAIQEVLNAFYNYLVAPKPRTPVPEPLSRFAAEVMVGTARSLIRLYLDGKDHIWLFILKNIPASIYLSQRKFDLVVGNPPWLSMRYLRNPQYRQRVRSMILQEYKLLDTRDTHLFTQMELASLFFARCADLYLKNDGLIGMVLPRAVMTADQHARFTSFSFKESGSQTLKLQRVIDLDQVTPLFNVPACVLIARNRQMTNYPVSGVVFHGHVPSRNASQGEAQSTLVTNETAFHRQSGKLIPEGQSIIEGPPSYYRDKFFQGASLVPRNMWFVRLSQRPFGYDPKRPPFETDPTANQRSKPRTGEPAWYTLSFSGNVEELFLYTTLIARDLVPFGYSRLRLVVLPIVLESNQLSLVNRDRALEQGYLGLAEWLANADREWSEKASRDEHGVLRISSVLSNINYRRKLTRQNPAAGYKVLHNRSGANIAATVVQGAGIKETDEAHGLERVGGFVADTQTHVFETESGNEAYFLAAVLNSPIVDNLIKPSHTRGLFGPKDIYTRAFRLPIPRFDSTNPVHNRVAELGQECHSVVSTVLPGIMVRFRSIGRIRGEVSRVLETQLSEINELVKNLLDQ